MRDETPNERLDLCLHGKELRSRNRLTALDNGASYPVVGRPITQALDPAAAAEVILEEMAATL
jgi:orotidine-5'-phosphate decarboxylase